MITNSTQKKQMNKQLVTAFLLCASCYSKPYGEKWAGKPSAFAEGCVKSQAVESLSSVFVLGYTLGLRMEEKLKLPWGIGLIFKKTFMCTH